MHHNTNFCYNTNKLSESKQLLGRVQLQTAMSVYHILYMV